MLMIGWRQPALLPPGSLSPMRVHWCSPASRRLVISATVTALLTAAPTALSRTSPLGSASSVVLTKS